MNRGAQPGRRGSTGRGADIAKPRLRGDLSRAGRPRLGEVRRVELAAHRSPGVAGREGSCGRPVEPWVREVNTQGLQGDGIGRRWHVVPWHGVRPFR